MLNELIKIIKKQTEINFINLETTIKTYNRNDLVCGAKAWRYVYHTIHSADKWYINPSSYKEPIFHEAGMDNPDNNCSVEIDDKQLLKYLYSVKCKTLEYTDTLSDNDLYEKPDGCIYTRLELILGQFRHISIHTGMINGLTIEKTERFPLYCGLDDNERKKLKTSLFYE